MSWIYVCVDYSDVQEHSFYTRFREPARDMDPEIALEPQTSLTTSNGQICGLQIELWLVIASHMIRILPLESKCC